MITALRRWGISSAQMFRSRMRWGRVFDDSDVVGRCDAVATRPALLLLLCALVFTWVLVIPAKGAVTREEVERAIQEGVRFLKSQQQQDGTWVEVDGRRAPDGTTALVTLASFDGR